MFIPKTVDFTIYQGSTFKQKWKLIQADTTNGLDLADYTARMQIRTKLKAPEFLVELTTENDGITITIDIDKTFIELFINAETTANLTTSKAVYDLEVIDTLNNVYRLMQGTVTISPEVTR